MTPISLKRELLKVRAEILRRWDAYIELKKKAEKEEEEKRQVERRKRMLESNDPRIWITLYNHDHY